MNSKFPKFEIKSNQNKMKQNKNLCFDFLYINSISELQKSLCSVISWTPKSGSDSKCLWGFLGAFSRLPEGFSGIFLETS